MLITDMPACEILGQTHTTLLDSLQRLEALFLRPSEGNIDAVRVQLNATQIEIAEHFQFEEKNGYFDVVRKRDPRFETAIQQLLEEHRQLTESLSALIAAADKAQNVNDELRQQAQRWVDHVRQHESQENKLIQEAFNSDLGTAD